MTPQQLKNSILQRAIEGRLVEQRPEEGTAQDLLKEIQAEKARLVKEGKIKKSKALPPITEEEKVFDIPEGWKWVRLGEVGLTNIGLTYKPTDTTNKDGIIVLRSSNIQNDRLTYDDIVRVKADIPENKMCNIGDILICARNGSKRLVGKAAIIEKDGMSFGAFMAIFKPLIVDSRYILHVINSAYFRNSLLKDTGTTTINQITQNMLKEFALPLPSLAEQRRIVAKIEELLPLIDKYDKAYTKLTDFSTRFPEAMKKSLLQYAIQGKLVEQCADEGTAQDLIKDIQAEKKRLIAEKKIKKPKALPPITEEEIPFDIPEGWEWVRLGEIIQISSGDGLTSKNMINEGIPVYGGNGVTGYHNRANVFKETVVIGRVGFYCGSVHITPHKAWVTDNAFITAYPEKYIDRGYLVYILKHMNLGQNNNATAQPVVSGKKIYPMLFPVPPLDEQRRIVAKLEGILPFCDQLIK